VRILDMNRDNKAERWRRVALAAAEQSGSGIPPRIDDPCALDAVLEQIKGYEAILIAWEEPGGVSIRHALQGHDPKRVALFIGPEGGFSAKEVERVVDAGGVTVTLGDTILRTETAAVVAGGLVLAEMGFLGYRS
jgi:16S rRNA (uracil1498-N3)-methyltransferase